MNFDLYYSDSTPTDSTEDNDVDINDIYSRLDSIDERLADISLSNRADTLSETERSSAQSEVDLASITDATSTIAENTTNIYTWVIVLAFIIVIFECKKILRGAIKLYYNGK